MRCRHDGLQPSPTMTATRGKLIEVALPLEAIYGETAKELAYRMFDICVKTSRTTEAQVYNALVTSWLEITRLSSSTQARLL